MGEVVLLGEMASRGRVEVCLDGGWTSVCDTMWTQEDAGVVCKQLGYSQATELGMYVHMDRTSKTCAQGHTCTFNSSDWSKSVG